MKGIEGLTLGRYELRKRIAQGGMAEVYLAYDRRVRRQVAIKVLYGRDEPFVRRFEREALAVGAFSHNHILPLYDFGEQSPWYYLVMPYVEGCNLRDYLLKRNRLTLEEAASFLDQIASALQYAHDHGVVHRDVKPSNILLRQDGYAYLLDFGLAKAMLGAESLTSSGAMVGTPEYMAPEQSNGLSDYRSDIYSLGVILYQMLAGRVPFTAESPVAISLKHIQTTPIPPREINSEIPQGVEDIILKALAKDPDERYQEAQALSSAYWKELQTIRPRPHPVGAGVEGKWGEDACVALAASEEEIIEASGHRPASGHPTASGHVQASGHSQGVPLPYTGGPGGAQLLVEPQALLYAPNTPILIPLTEQLASLSLPRATRNASRRLRSRPTMIVLALAFLIPLIVALPLGLLTWQAQQSHAVKMLSAQAAGIQQQLKADMTATADAQAQLQAKLAAEARVQATAGITSAIGAGTVLYRDDITNAGLGTYPSCQHCCAASTACSGTTRGGGWIDDGYQCYFSSAGYHVQTPSAHEVAWCYSAAQQFSNIVITAQAQLLRGDVYGLIFRLNPQSRQFYVMEINKQGAYRFVRASGTNPLNWLTLIDWTPSSAILSGYGHLNTFLVVATGSHFSFYINKQLLVSSFTDTSNTPYTTGLVGFLVGGDSAGGTEAVFSNVWVFQK